MGRTFFKILNLGLLACVLLAACNKDRNKGAQPANPGQAPPTAGAGERNVYIACEGAYGNGNASLSMQNLAGFTSYNDVYFTVNSQALGDVFQSIARIDDQLFLCINNSDKVIVIDAATRKHKGVLNIPKPRYVLPINSEKAYVSTLYSNKVYIINPKTLSITGTIELPAQNPEGMLVRGSKAYICPWDINCNKVYIVSIVTDQLVDSYEVAGYAPQQAVTDNYGTVWVLSGNVEKKRNAALTQLAPGSRDIMKSLNFKDLQDVMKPVMNSAGDMLYFLGVDYQGKSGYNGVYRMKTTDGTLPQAPFIPAQKNQYFWGLGIDPVTDEIYVGDPKGFVQKGQVSVYTAEGQQKCTFGVGVGPGYFYFDE